VGELKLSGEEKLEGGEVVGLGVAFVERLGDVVGVAEG
jgi:hypothetical protein